MKRRTIRHTAAALVVSVALWTVPVVTSAATVAPQSSALPNQTSQLERPVVSLEDRVREWVDSIAKQEGWQEWAAAEREINTLGPGTHAWIVQLRAAGKAVGYLIVNATEDGDYALSEYGQGESPLFSETTLNDALSWQGISTAGSDLVKTEPLFIDALQALWQVEANGQRFFLDAHTGESLPFDTLPKETASALLKTGTKLSGTSIAELREPFDPYEKMTWVQAEPIPVKNAEDIKSAFKHHERVTFVGDLYENSHHVPLAVTGYAVWPNSTTFVGFSSGTGGARYIPLESALSLGNFYP